MTTCDGCRFLKQLTPDSPDQYCTRFPPKLELLRTGDTIRLNGWYTPRAIVACGEYSRRWPWTRA